MKSPRRVFLVVSLALLLPVLTGTVFRTVADAKDAGEDSLYKYLDVFTDILNLVRRAYVEETSMEMLIAGAMEGASDALDPLSTYVPFEAADSYKRIRDIGSSLSGVTVAKERGIAYVVAVESGSPGESAGLASGDVLSAIGDESTRLLPLWRIQQAFAAGPGSTVHLEFLREGEPTKVTLELAEFAVPEVSVAERDGVSILRLHRVDSTAVVQVAQRLSQLAATGQGKLILDLRGLAGGSAESAFELGELFASGSLGELRGTEGTVETYRTVGEPAWTGDLVILIDRGSQGAAEVVASVLRQASGARLVGQPSFGHAGRQRVTTLSDGSLFVLTEAYYAGPDGRPIKEPLSPDVEVTERTRSFGEQEVPLDELMIERGIQLLLDEASNPVEAVA